MYQLELRVLLADGNGLGMGSRCSKVMVTIEHSLDLSIRLLRQILPKLLLSLILRLMFDEVFLAQLSYVDIVKTAPRWNSHSQNVSLRVHL